MKSCRFFWLCLMALGQCLAVSAQTPGRNGACSVSEFRSMALLTHDVAERIAKVNDWLQQKGGKCTPAQLAAIASNRATWLGTADTVAISSGIDALMEAKIVNDPDQMAAMFSSKGKEGRASVEVTKPPPAPAPVVPPPAPVQIAGNVNVNVAPVPPQILLPAEAELPDEFFTRRQKRDIQQFYEESRGSEECPKGLTLRGEKCESRVKVRPWKLRQALPPNAKTEELPVPLALKLGPPPAEHQYKRVGGDILMLKGPQMVVTDAVLDLGGIGPMKPRTDESAEPSEPPKSGSAPGPGPRPPVKRPREAP
jgi:hypothetical protein